MFWLLYEEFLAFLIAQEALCELFFPQFDITFLRYQSIIPGVWKKSFLEDKYHLLAVIRFVGPVGLVFAGVILAKG